MATVETLGKYEIRKQIGRGAMGTVYEAWDPHLQRRVAIKTVGIPDAADPETEEQLARFRREAQAAGSLIHPNIVGVFDYGETNDLAYIVMEFIDGPTLKSVMDEHERFALPEIMRIMKDVLAGLQFSHERGVVHRDIKPANIMLTSNRQAKIADFGIARIESSSMTQAGTIMGTPAYMSPEQFMAETVDARTDLWSAGVLLYQLLTGERPFEGALSAIMHKALHTEPPAPSQLAMTAPTELDAVVRKAMAKRPADRFSSATAFAQALEAPAEFAASQGDGGGDGGGDATIMAPRQTPAPARPPAATVSPPAVPAPASGSKLPLLAGLGVAVLAVAGAGGYFLLSGSGPPAQPGSSVQVQGAAPGTGTVATGPQGTGTQGTGTAAVGVQPPGAPQEAVPRDTPPPDNTATRRIEPPPATPQTPSSIRAQVTRLLAGQRCAMVEGDVNDAGRVALGGVASSQVAEDIRREIARLGPPGGVDWTLGGADPVFCPVVDLLQPIGPRFGETGVRVGLGLADGKTALKDGEFIRPRLVMPNFPSYLRVDYFARDGNVQHLYPQVNDPKNGITADPVRALAGGERLSLGDGRPGSQRWEATEPYGTDMIIAVASSLNLFDHARPANVEAAAPYVRDLREAIEGLRTKGGRLAASALLVETMPK